MFGTGFSSRVRIKWFMDYFKIQPDCYCDNNPDLWGKILYGRPCVSPSELQESMGNHAVINAVGLAHQKEVATQLKDMGIVDWISAFDLMLPFKTDAFLQKWIGVDGIKKYERPARPAQKVLSGKQYAKGNRIAVYTAIAGGYDKLPKYSCFPQNVDYYLLTDRPSEPFFKGTVLDINRVVPSEVDRNDGTLMNRYCKLNADRIFPEYRYSVYIDGNLSVVKDISDYVEFISDVGFTTFQNLLHPDAYVEGFSVVTLGYGNDAQIRNQLRRYALEGCPRTPFAIQGTVIARDHDNETANKIFSDWYLEFVNGARRDQIAIPYVMWKHNVDFDSFTRLPAERLRIDFKNEMHKGARERFHLEN